MSETFKVGDVVRLKSGGPKMTVVEVRTGSVTCVWFDKTAQQRGEFPPDALEVPQPPDYRGLAARMAR